MAKSKFPEVRDDLRDFEKLAAVSIDVLVHVKGFQNPMVGRYIHGAQEWQVDGIHGTPTVIEWWLLPEKGTGTPC
ncbi:hypothetical protein [Vibrio crassostreae]|uniref:hypothetical protein n=1 Tax=Vibrio crassostreae TaxID=246167 RepID=UPI001B3145FA|nr:hypothetical protein [Vibrio crassostreae]